MATIVVTPLRYQSDEPSFEPIQLQFFFIADDILGFDRIEIWRSTTVAAGPYEEITAAGAQPARLPKDAGVEPPSVVLNPYLSCSGDSLTMLAGGLETDILFAGTDPLPSSAWAAQITAGSVGRLHTYLDATGQVVIETIAVGTSASLEVTGGDAAATLSLPTELPDSLAYGKEARVALVHGVLQYTFTDYSGCTAYFYRTRMRNQSTGAVSAFSPALDARQPIGLSTDLVVRGYLDLIDVDGKPLGSRSVSVHSATPVGVVDGRFMAGLNQVKDTDTAGHVEFILVRGTHMTVAIAGTDLARAILVPTDLTILAFNMLDSTVADGPDIFVVQRPDIEYAERRTI